MRFLLAVPLAALLLGCPKPLPDTPAPADLAALDARLVEEPTAAFRVAFYAGGGRVGGGAVRLGPGQRVEVAPDDGPAVVLDEARTRVVRFFLRRGAADLLATLAAAPDTVPPALPREVPGLRTGGWEYIDGQARGLLFPADGVQTILWLDDDTSLPIRRDTEFLRAFEVPEPPTEVYSDWAFGD